MKIAEQKVIHTYLLLSPNSIIWYQLRLGVEVLTCGYGDVELGNGLQGVGLCWVIQLTTGATISAVLLSALRSNP